MLNRENVRAYAEGICGIEETDLTRVSKSLSMFTRNVIQGAEKYALHCNRKTIVLRDISHALWDHGIAACEPMEGKHAPGTVPICKTAHSFIPDKEEGASLGRRKSIGGSAVLTGNPSFCGGIHNQSQCGEMFGICMSGGGRGGEDAARRSKKQRRHSQPKSGKAAGKMMFINWNQLRKHMACIHMVWNWDALKLLDDSVRYKLHEFKESRARTRRRRNDK